MKRIHLHPSMNGRPQIFGALEPEADTVTLGEPGTMPEPARSPWPSWTITRSSSEVSNS